MSIIPNKRGADPIVRNQKVTSNLSVGDYVFASRWSDCDPGDPWCVGHITFLGDAFVVVGDVSQRRFPHAMKISLDQGERIIETYPGLERKPCDFKQIAAIFNGMGSTTLPIVDEVVDTQEVDRRNLLVSMQDQINSYFLDWGDMEPWECVDPELDSIRTQIQAII